MNVPTANVVVGFNKEVMLRLFSEGATFTNLVKGLTEDSDSPVLLFENESNPNFISFEHAFGLKMGNHFKLSFIDPNAEFEKRFFSTNVGDQIAGTYEQSPENIKMAIEQDALCDEVKKSLEAMKSAELLEDYVKTFNAKFGEKTLYIAYGTGNNLDLWAGPHAAKLTGANITMKGSRKIDLRLAGNPMELSKNNRRGLFNEVVDLDLAGLTSRYTGFSENIEFSNFLPADQGGQTGEGTFDTVDGFGVGYNPLRYMGLSQGDNLVTQIQLKNESFIESFPEIQNEFSDFDFHSIIVDALRMYIQNATNNPNVIVLLPNINQICRQIIADESRNATRVNTAARQTLPTGTPFEQATGAQTTAGPQLGTLKNNAVQTAYRNDMTDLARKKLFIENFLTSFGLLMNETRRSEQDHTLPLKALPQEKANAFESVERGKTYYEAAVNYYRDRIFQGYIESSSKKGIPDHKEKIDNVIDAINKRSKGEYQIEKAYINETDVRVLDYWSDPNNSVACAKYPLFGGYTDFNSDKEAIIVGDQALIANFLYAAQDSDDSGDIPLHPLDRQILTNKTYKKKMDKIVRPKLDNVGSFGDIGYIPDDFAYEDAEFTEEQKKFIKEKRIPVFRHNTTNPNIIDLKFNYAPHYFLYLKQGFAKAVDRRASAVAQGVLPEGVSTFKIKTIGQAAEYLVRKNYSLGMAHGEKQKVIDSLATRLDPELVSSIGETDAEESAKLLAAILDEVFKANNLFGTVDIDQMLPGTPIDIFTDFANQMFRKTYSLNIKTLPTFYLSTMALGVQAPCIVFAQDVDIRKTNPTDRTLMNRFFSGQYKIQGFKHVISTSTAHSEFVLTKNAPDFNKMKKKEEQENVE